MLPSRRLVFTIAALVLLASGCGDGAADDEERAELEPVDGPALPPPGWRTVRNAAAGFNVSVPKRWSAATKGVSSIIRSDDRLVSIRIGADRSASGRALPAARYARETIRGLPGFEGRVRRAGRVRGSPYASARVEAAGRVRASPVPQRITVATFQRPGRVTYSAIVFRNATVRPRFNNRRIDRLLRSFRAEKPRP